MVCDPVLPEPHNTHNFLNRKTRRLPHRLLDRLDLALGLPVRERVLGHPCEYLEILVGQR